MNNELPWFAKNVDAWMTSKTIRLAPPEAWGIYDYLLCLQWKHGILPKSLHDMVMLIGSGYVTIETMERVWPFISNKFEETPEGFVNLKLEEERKKAFQTHQKRSEAGRKGGRPSKPGLRREKAGLKAGKSPAPHNNTYKDTNRDINNNKGHKQEHLHKETTQDSSHDESRVKKAKSIYDWKHYQFDRETWRVLFEDGICPDNEGYETMLIGWYLIRMKKLQNKVVKIRPTQFSKLKGQVAHCIEFFTDHEDGDDKAGYLAAGEYITWFCSQEAGTYIANASFSLDLMFSIKTMNDYMVTPVKTQKKNTQDKLRDIVNAAGYVNGNEERLKLKTRRL